MVKFSKGEKEWIQIQQDSVDLFGKYEDEPIRKQKFDELIVPKLCLFFVKWNEEIKNNKFKPMFMEQINKYRTEK